MHGYSPVEIKYTELFENTKKGHEVYIDVPKSVG